MMPHLAMVPATKVLILPSGERRSQWSWLSYVVPPLLDVVEDLISRTIQQSEAPGRCGEHLCGGEGCDLLAGGRCM